MGIFKKKKKKEQHTHDKMIVNIENEEDRPKAKLGLIDRITLRKAFKEHDKKMAEREKTRDEIIEDIMQMTELFLVTDDKTNEPISEESLGELEDKELMQLYVELFEQLKKVAV